MFTRELSSKTGKCVFTILLFAFKFNNFTVFSFSRIFKYEKRDDWKEKIGNIGSLYLQSLRH